VCVERSGRWYYLRSGGRAPGDPPPKGDPCQPPRPRNQPEPIRSSADYAELGARALGHHEPLGGFRLGKRRFLSRDLVIFDAGRAPLGIDPPPPAAPAAERLLRFVGRDEAGHEESGPDQAVVAVERFENTAIVQVGDEVRIYTMPDETRLITRRGTFLRRCDDGRVLAWSAAGTLYRLFDAWSGHDVAFVPRERGYVVGADAACRSLYAQRLDGALVELPLAGGPARQLALADGYVYDVRPSPPRGVVGPGLWIALSSGAVARIDDGSAAAPAAVRLYGYAAPLASALADGPRPGEVAFADATGVVFLDAAGAARRALEASGDTIWEDISVAPDAQSMLLASADRIAAADLPRRQLLGSIEVDGKGRLSRWDDEGSVIAWSFDRRGPVEGLVVPRGVPLAKAVAEAVSNLDVEKGRLGPRR
jgi:hypothetical protein